jgi:hypothetical protein
MSERLWYRPWDILARLGIAGSTAVLIWIKLPLAHTLPILVVLVQFFLFLTLLIYPPRLDSMLLCDQIEERAKTADGATIVLAVLPAEIGHPYVTVQAAQVLGTAVDKSAKVKFARELAAAKVRRISDWFLVAFVPIVMVVALTCCLSILQQSVLNTGHISSGPGISPGPPSVDFVIPFLQGLIGLIPFVWVIGHLLGEVTCHRDTVFKALS